MEQFVGSDLVLLTLTVGFYCLGSALYSRTKFALLHPVLLGFVAMILYLKLFGIGYEHYRRSTELLNFGLGLSVVALGYLMYEQLEHMRGRLLPILVSVVVGCVVGVLSVVYLARMLGADRILQTSLAPKSVTVPIAVSVAEPLGGIITITSVVVFCVGISAVSSVPGCFGVAGSRILWHRDSRWGLRRMASERPVRSKSVRWKGRSAVWLWH